MRVYIHFWNSDYLSYAIEPTKVIKLKDHDSTILFVVHEYPDYKVMDVHFAAPNVYVYLQKKEGI